MAAATKIIIANVGDSVAAVVEVAAAVVVVVCPTLQQAVLVPLRPQPHAPLHPTPLCFENKQTHAHMYTCAKPTAGTLSIQCSHLPTPWGLPHTRQVVNPLPPVKPALQLCRSRVDFPQQSCKPTTHAMQP